MPTLQEPLMKLAEATAICPQATYHGDTIPDLLCSACKGTSKVPLLPTLRRECWCECHQVEIPSNHLCKKLCAVCEGRLWVLAEDIKGGDVITAMHKAGYLYNAHNDFKGHHVGFYRPNQSHPYHSGIAEGENFDAVAIEAAVRCLSLTKPNP